MRKFSNLVSLEWRNTLLLYFIRGLQMIFPLITLPYLTRVLDKDNFGTIVFCQTFASLMAVIIEYGFNYTATREIAEAQQDITLERHVFSNVTVSKLLIAVPIFITGMIYFLLSNLSIYLFIFTYILILSQGFMPIWYFQGRSSMFVISFMELLSRIISLIGIFLLVKDHNQGALYIAIIAIIGIIISILQNCIILNKVGINKVTFAEAFVVIKDGFSFFILRIGSILYSSGSVFLLSLLVAKPQLAIYGGADRVFRAAAGLTGPIGDAFYPRIVATRTTDPVKSKKLTTLASSVLIVGSVILSGILFLLTDRIIELLLGIQYEESKPIFKILVWDIPLIAIGTCLGIFGLLPRRLDKSFSTSVLIGGIFSLISILFGVPYFGLKWMAITIVLAEIIVIVYCSFALIRHRRVNG